MQTKRFFLYVLNTMSDWEYGHLIAELNSGRYFKKELAPLKVTTVGASNEMITTMGGLNICPDISFEDCRLESEDLLLLPGATTWNEEIHQPILNEIGKALEMGTTVGAICGAVEGLANRGYLDTRKHTSNNLDYTKLTCPNYKGEELYKLRSVVSDENLVTASGIAPLEFAMEVLKKLDVMEPDALHSWYSLNKTHESEHFLELIKLANK
ncbi:ThiJ/PfpI family protein [Bacillus sp. JCM 19047]|nr:ThiJ/PfpI family protein [Bacillus sp. JCM 19047]